MKEFDYGMRKCLICGKEFRAVRVWDITCSKECQLEWRRNTSRRCKLAGRKKHLFCKAENAVMREKLGLGENDPVPGVDYEKILSEMEERIARKKAEKTQADAETDKNGQPQKGHGKKWSLGTIFRHRGEEGEQDESIQSGANTTPGETAGSSVSIIPETVPEEGKESEKNAASDAQQADRPEIPKGMAECPVCHKPFKPDGPKHIFCSKECREKFRNG